MSVGDKDTLRMEIAAYMAERCKCGDDQFLDPVKGRRSDCVGCMTAFVMRKMMAARMKAQMEADEIIERGDRRDTHRVICEVCRPGEPCEDYWKL